MGAAALGNQQQLSRERYTARRSSRADLDESAEYAAIVVGAVDGAATTTHATTAGPADAHRSTHPGRRAGSIAGCQAKSIDSFAAAIHELGPTAHTAQTS